MITINSSREITVYKDGTLQTVWTNAEVVTSSNPLAALTAPTTYLGKSHTGKPNNIIF